MNDRFKFRAWDGHKMDTTNAIVCLGVSWNGVRDCPDGRTLMQCTGLRDKNGVEIFEGDVVKAFIGGDCYGTGQVIFDRGIFWIQWIDDPQADMEPVSCLSRPFGKTREPLEIIGNIHQHKHLIESK